MKQIKRTLFRTVGSELEELIADFLSVRSLPILSALMNRKVGIILLCSRRIVIGIKAIFSKNIINKVGR
ncbi:hypothetical protein CS542_06380 [Pedobacter sp. IW39]|nr:hypothetical protein CS542_06380 [Pedobacter sp. IW39]